MRLAFLVFLLFLANRVSGNDEKTADASSGSSNLQEVFENLSASDLAKLGAMFYLPYASRAHPHSHPDEVRQAYDLDMDYKPSDLWMAGVAVDMLSLRPDRPHFAEKFRERFTEHGVVVMPSVVDPELCQKTARAAMHAIEHPKPGQTYGRIMKSEFRKDMPLDWEAPFTDIMYAALAPIGEIMLGILGQDATMVEYGTLTSYPGAESQVMHADTPMEEPGHAKWARLISCYVYLSNVTTDQAPLDVWPGTHTHVHFYNLDKMVAVEEGNAMPVLSPAVRMAVPIGTMVMYDSRVFHRGTENLTPRARPTLYFSFMSDSGERPIGSTFSMKKKYAGWKLRDILSRKVENPQKSAEEEEIKERIKMCAKAMYAHCAKTMRAVWSLQFPPFKVSQACYECGATLFGREFFGCKDPNHIERVCKFGIYHQDYKSEL